MFESFRLTHLWKTAGFLLLGLVLVSMLSMCVETNEVTGRTHLSLVSNESLLEDSAIYYEEAIDEYRAEGMISKDRRTLRRVTDITNRIIDQAVRYRKDSASWQWDLHLIDDPEEVNAWCMPGGKMVIYTGLIEQLNLNDDEIAMIMGHEIAHAMAGHSAEGESIDVLSSFVVSLVAGVLGADANQAQEIEEIGALSVLGLILLPYSRASETEADRLGIEFATQAGFDPRAAEVVWRKMSELEAELGEDAGAEFLSTHPSNERRSERLAALALDMQNLPKDTRTQFAESRKGGNPWIKKDHNKGVEFNPVTYVEKVPALKLMTVDRPVKQEEQEGRARKSPKAKDSDS